jgi:hypothetical protein
MYGLLTWATPRKYIGAGVPPTVLHAQLFPEPVGSTEGLAYFVPNPEPDQGYTEIKGVREWATAIVELSDENSTPFPEPPVGNVEGLVYFAPNPDPDQG